MESLYQWLVTKTDPLVAAANFTSVIFLLVLCFTTIMIIRNRNFGPDSDVRLILWGVVLESAAWALHRLFWGTWRIAREYHWEGLEQTFVENSYVAIAPSFLVLAGLGLILSPLWKTCVIPWNMERTTVNYLIPAGLIVGVFYFLFVTIDQADESFQKELEYRRCERCILEYEKDQQL